MVNDRNIPNVLHRPEIVTNKIKCVKTSLPVLSTMRAMPNTPSDGFTTFVKGVCRGNFSNFWKIS